MGLSLSANIGQEMQNLSCIPRVFYSPIEGVVGIPLTLLGLKKLE